MTIDLQCRGRGKPYAVAEIAEGGCTVRVDDYRDLTAWVEVELPASVLREMLRIQESMERLALAAWPGREEER